MRQGVWSWWDGMERGKFTESWPTVAPINMQNLCMGKFKTNKQQKQQQNIHHKNTETKPKPNVNLDKKSIQISNEMLLLSLFFYYFSCCCRLAKQLIMLSPCLIP